MLSEISSASYRAILPMRGAGDGIGGLIAIDSLPLAVASPFTWPLPSHTEAVILSIGSLRFGAATNCKLTDRALDVEFDPRHLREQIDIREPDRTSAELHVGRH